MLLYILLPRHLNRTLIDILFNGLNYLSSTSAIKLRHKIHRQYLHFSILYFYYYAVLLYSCSLSQIKILYY